MSLILLRRLEVALRSELLAIMSVPAFRSSSVFVLEPVSMLLLDRDEPSTRPELLDKLLDIIWFRLMLLPLPWIVFVVRWKFSLLCSLDILVTVAILLAGGLR